MGDAEATGTGVETGARVHVGLRLEKGTAPDWPWLETPDLLITTASAPDFEQASELAVQSMLDQLSGRLGVSRLDAFYLVGARGDVRVNQACRANIDVSVRVEFPKIWR